MPTPPVDRLYLCIVKHFLLSLFFVLSFAILWQEHAYAQTEKPKPARMTVQSGVMGTWDIDCTVSYHTTATGFDSVVIAHGHDTSRVILAFEPPIWMPQLHSYKLRLAQESTWDTDPGANTIRYISRSPSKRNSVRVVDWYRPSKFDRYFRKSVTNFLIDSTTGQQQYRMDSTFDHEGHLREVIFDSNAVTKEGSKLLWSHGRLILTFLGARPWLIRSTQTGNDALLTKDSTGKDIIRVEGKAAQRSLQVIELPAGYNLSALSFGPRIDSAHKSDEKNTSTLRDLKWRQLPSHQTLDLIGGYVYDGKYINSYIEERRERRKELRRDTVDHIFDSDGRLLKTRNGNEATAYKYNAKGLLIEEVESYGSRPWSKKMLSQEIIDSELVAENYTGIKIEPEGEASMRDTTITRNLFDYRYPGFADLAQFIDDIATVTNHGGILKVQLLKAIKDIKLELVSARGKLVAQSHSGALSTKGLSPGIYQLRYSIGHKRLYDQTIAIDRERKW
jgi:YD repeat-containing protein